MRLFQWLKKKAITLSSCIRPIDQGYNFSVPGGESLHLEQDPTGPNFEIVEFYKLRHDLGPFEVTEMKKNRNGVVIYTVYHVDSDKSMTIPKPWFELMFESYSRTTTTSDNGANPC